MTKQTKKKSAASKPKDVKQTAPESAVEGSESGVGRRRFLTIGAAGLATASAAGFIAKDANALLQSVDRTIGLGVTPGSDTIAEMPKYTDSWNRISSKPFGGFRFALGYIGEGVDMMDPKQDVPNPSGLFESARPDIISAVGGNENAERSAEYWYRDILGWENETLANDFWSFINWARRIYGLDFDDPSVDGMETALGNFSYAGSPNPNDELSLWSPRIASDGKGGYARMAPTLLAPSVGYTVVFRAGHAHPNYSGGTTAGSPDDPGKVRDGGVWGGTVESLDVLRTMQEVAAGERTYTTPNGPSNNPAQWGQWWRRVAPLDGVDIEALDADAPISERPAPRPNWPVGYLSRGTDYFWGNYDLKFGRDEPTVVLHYESQVPTRFRDFDGIPEAFICELNAHPGGTDMPQSQIDMGLQDVDGSISGFADINDPTLNDQNPFGHGRVHGTSYPRGVDAQGRTTFHLRNWLLFPPRLNAVNSINDSVPGKGALS